MFMETNAPSFLRLSDAELITEVARLAAREREATVDLIQALAVFDARQLYLGEGFPSLFAFCTERLRLSEHEAYHRIEAARAARRFPQVLEQLRGGRLTLTTVRLLGPHLTEANCREVLAAAAGKSKREVEVLVAAMAPRPDVPASIRKVPERRAVSSDVAPREEPRGPSLLEAEEAGPAATSGPEGVERRAVPQPARPAIVRPLTSARYYLQMTVSADTQNKLRRLQDLMRREIPSGDPAAIVDQALTLLLERAERRAFAATTGRRKPRIDAGAASQHADPGLLSVAGASLQAGPRRRRRARLPEAGCDDQAGATDAASSTPAKRRPSRPARRSRRIPAAVRREVWRRDGGRCGYVAADGVRCSATTLLEYHHRVPVADGGANTVDNTMLVCVMHHRRESARVFEWTRVPESAATPG